VIGPDGGRPTAPGGPWVVRGPRVYVTTTVRRTVQQVARDVLSAVTGWLVVAGAWLLVTAQLVAGAVAALVAAACGWPPPAALARVVREHVQDRRRAQHLAVWIRPARTDSGQRTDGRHGQPSDRQQSDRQQSDGVAGGPRGWEW